MECRASLLVVDDDREIRTLLAGYLDANGYRTQAVADGAEMWEALTAGHYDLLVLDLNLPGEDGLTLCRTLRSRSTLPVIMLTARDTPVDRIVGLEMGADDYLAKPFEPRELLARIRSVLRRAQPPPATIGTEERRLRFGLWVLDVPARHLINADGLVVALSGAEYRLLRVFVEHRGQILTRDRLLDLTRGREIDAFDRSIDLQVSRLRQKLRDDARSPRIIKTVRSEGYVFTPSISHER